jgi:hypothetical protein
MADLVAVAPPLGIILAPARRALLSVKLAHVYIIGVFMFL